MTSEAVPFCSVIVPTRARPRTLAGCLTALSRLEYPPDRFEIVVVDDGGGGGTSSLSSLVQEMRSRLSLRLLVQEHAGPSAARNTGARSAGGELLVFTDDDCQPHRHWLQRLAAAYPASPDCGFGGRAT